MREYKVNLTWNLKQHKATCGIEIVIENIGKPWQGESGAKKLGHYLWDNAGKILQGEQRKFWWENEALELRMAEYNVYTDGSRLEGNCGAG